MPSWSSDSSQLALRHQHAVGHDAAHGTLVERDLRAGNVGADRREHADHAGAGVGRPAYDLEHAAAGIDLAHLQLVGVGMLARP